MAVDFRNVTFTYAASVTPTLVDVSLHIDEGELIVVTGETGAGKSTLLRLINGLAPHFTGGTLAGDVITGGRSIRSHQPRDLADVVGVVLQDPLSGFVTDTVEDELAYSMECLGLDPATMRKRIEETLDILGLASLRQRSIRALSGGQQQRVAIGAVLVAHPQILVLDEPTSALDPNAAEDVLATLQRLVHDVGLTVIIAEHRLERVLQYADRVVSVTAGGAVGIGNPRTMMEAARSVPPIISLAKTFNWNPLPLTVREARTAAGPLRAALADTLPPLRVVDSTPDPIAVVEALTVRYGTHTAVHDANFALNAGELCVLMGRNGAGKSTLLRALSGDRTPDHGTVRILGRMPQAYSRSDFPRTIGVVPQQAGDLLLGARVAAECRAADTDSGIAPGTTRALLALLAPEIEDGAHPRELSEGQRLALALAIVLAPQPALLLLDEPTRGLDYSGKARLATILRQCAAAGTAVLLATHDVELAAEIAHNVIVIADGDIVANDTAGRILTTSPLFAPQIAKVMSPAPWLTSGDVVTAWRARS